MGINSSNRNFSTSLALLAATQPSAKSPRQYGLRWDAPQETAYPSTFLIDSKGVIFFSKISKSHGGRTTATEVLEELKK